MHPQPSLLITLRHPGPADFIAAALPLLAERFAMTLLATDTAARLLLERHVAALQAAHVRLVAPGEFCPAGPAQRLPGDFIELAGPPAAMADSQTLTATQLDAADLAGAKALLGRLEAFVAAFPPDHVLRTTPSHGLGVDELIGVALANQGLERELRCFQDYYGVGVALGHSEHAVASRGVDAIATIDGDAARIVAERYGLPADPIGWIGHEQFLSGPTYPPTRDQARGRLGLAAATPFILYAGTHSNLPDDNDINDFAAVVRGVEALSRRRPSIQMGFKPHPRTDPATLASYRQISAQAAVNWVDLAALDSYRQFLAAPDLIVSIASAMNLDSLAFAGASLEHPGAGWTASLYTTGAFSRRAMEHLTGFALLPTHQPGRGSFLAPYEGMDRALESALFDAAARADLFRESRRIYRPSGATAGRLLAFLAADPPRRAIG